MTKELWEKLRNLRRTSDWGKEVGWRKWLMVKAEVEAENAEAEAEEG